MNRFGFGERKSGSFEELALEAGAWAEDDVVGLGDEDKSSLEPDWLSGTSGLNLTEGSLLNERAGPLPHMRNRDPYGAPERLLTAHSFEPTVTVLPFEEALLRPSAAPGERFIAADRAHLSAAPRREAKALSSATTPSCSDMAAPLNQLARLLGRSWARDRRERMVEGLGGGLRVWRGL